MKVVVTGASGHIGANLVRMLLDRPGRVRVLVHRNTMPLEGLDIEVFSGDVLDFESLRAAFEGVDIVYHLAAVISIVGDPDGRVRSVNVAGVENVARAALMCGVRRMVHCSSVHSFDMRQATGTLDETARRVADDPGRHAAYDRSKAEGERRVRAVIDEGLDAVIVHPTSVIGPYDFEPSRMGQVFVNLHRRRLPSLVEGGFDFVDVRDVAQGIIAAAEHGARGESYLLSGEHHRIPAIAAMAEAITGKKAPRLTVPVWVARLGTPVMKVAARLTRSEPLYTSEALAAIHRSPTVGHAKASRDLGYTPRPTEETVRDTYRWFAATGRLPADTVLGDRPGAGRTMGE